MERFNIMKLKDFAKEIGTPESTVRTWKRRGEIPATCFFNIGSTVFVKVNEIQQWIGQTA
jgi:prefoldin subunit 5